jgi:hypothetical protein
MVYLSILTPVFSGIIGTAIMSLFTFASFYLMKRHYYVVRTLGLILNYGKHARSFQRPTTTYYLLAAFLHYAIGIFFAYVYVWALREGFMELSLMQTVLYGILIGFIGISGWNILLMTHHYPLRYSLKVYFTIIWLGHILLALTLFCIYQRFDV